ncbi:hypothetical protein [Sanguibacter keddieii]|uniref:hypothetical protein n=1 Tax=Sanguibacter keddieii TaxID=60920 RepID=UPI0002F94881|nr:hypothetical protein [Sanguibacter keddieii]
MNLSDAVVLFLAGFPRHDGEKYLAAVDDETTRAAVQALLDETRQIPVEWGNKTLPEIGQEVRDELRRRHPELSETAVNRLGSYFTYLVR